MIEIKPQRKRSIIFRNKDSDNTLPLDEIFSTTVNGRPYPNQNRSRRLSVPQPPYRYGSVINPLRNASAVIKTPGIYSSGNIVLPKQNVQIEDQKNNNMTTKDLNDYSEEDESELSEEDQKRSKKLLMLPRKGGYRLVDPLDVIKEGPVRQAQYSGRKYKIKARPRSYLLSIIALQAVAGPYPLISKVFEAALNKVNPDMLVWARYIKTRKKKSKIAKLWEKLKKAVIHPLSPESSIILYLDILLFFTILQHAFFATYLVTFIPDGYATHDNPFIIADYVADVIYIIKMLLTFHTGFYDRGEINYNHKDIARHYLKSNFIIDAISLLDIVGYFFINSNLKAFQAFAVLRLYRIPGTIQVFEDYFLVSREFSYMIQVLTLALTLFVYGHLLACALYALAYRNRDDPNNWFTKNGFEGQDSGNSYATSLYFALETASTLGYGDITPGTTGERIFFVPLMIASAILFGYVTSVTGRILSEMSMLSYEARERIRLLKKYMRDKGVQKMTQNKIIKYSRYFLSRENLSKVKDENMVKFLSTDLREDLIKEVNVKILSQCKMFTYNFRTKFLLMVSRTLVERAFGPDEVIFRYRERDDLSVYFLISGRVEAYYARLGISLGVIDQSGAFGFASFFNGKCRPNDMRSLEFTTVFQLKRDTFLNKLKDFPSERETYYLIKDSMVMYNDYKHLVNTHCILCGEKDHIALVCPLYHWYPDEEKVIQKHLHKQKHLRKHFKRKNRPRISALGRMNDIQNAALRLQNMEISQLSTHYIKKFKYEYGFDSDSSAGETLEKDIYQLPTFTFHADAHHAKKMKLTENAGLNSADAVNILDCIETKPALGEIERFVVKNYDSYYRNLNIDRVKNYETYFPHNNVLVIIAEWERIRLKNIAKMCKISEKVLHEMNIVVENTKRRKNGRSSKLNRSYSNLPLPSIEDSEIPRPSLMSHKSLHHNQSTARPSRFSVNENSDRSENQTGSQKKLGSRSPRRSIFLSSKTLTQFPDSKQGEPIHRSTSLPKGFVGQVGDWDLSDEDYFNQEHKAPFVESYRQSRLLEHTEESKFESRRSIPLRKREKNLRENTGKKNEEVTSLGAMLEGEESESSESDEDQEEKVEKLKLAMRKEFEGLMERMAKRLKEKKKNAKNYQSKQ